MSCHPYRETENYIYDQSPQEVDEEIPEDRRCTVCGGEILFDGTVWCSECWKPYKRRKEPMYTRRPDCKVTGIPPYGKRRDANGDFEDHPEEATTIARALFLILEGHGWTETAKILNSEGSKPRWAKNGWNLHNLKSMMEFSGAMPSPEEMAEVRKKQTATCEGDNQNRVATKARILALTKGGMGLCEVARVFNREGVPTFSGKGKWYQASVSKVLEAYKE